MCAKVCFALELPAEAKALAVGLSQEIARKFSCFFQLGETTNFPHITVYSAEFSDESIPQVKEAVARVVASWERLVCQVGSVETHQGYIGVEILNYPAIADFHLRLIEAVSPLRVRGQDHGEQYRMSLNSRQLQCIELYGYPDAMELYKPHFTITRFKNEAQTVGALAEVRWTIPRFTTNALGMYIMGDHGTCSALLGGFKFPPVF